ncbi:type II toxin-antitoxin system RatA family toxin [Streptomyces scopuliridis]|uniref:type II toxin-antitoxin system RatA family toxin n=1 Tax=Streptomyces scopuliridis TaxID=452529 RepID=UPI0036BC60DD
MRHVELKALVPSEDARTVFESVIKWERYPELAPHVRTTTVHATLPAAECGSSWELDFRSGLLRWTERDEFSLEDLTARFEQTDGDFDSFTGLWTLRQEGADVAVDFEADFDFGIPSLQGILDPIAERVIKESVAWAVTGMYPGTRLLGDASLDDVRPETTAA